MCYAPNQDGGVTRSCFDSLAQGPRKLKRLRVELGEYAIVAQGDLVLQALVCYNLFAKLPFVIFRVP